MSENFDDLLSGVVDTAAGAARQPGAAAARKRGHQRRTRRRVAASTLSLAVLGVIGGVAATTVPGGTNGVPTAHRSSTAAPAPSASDSPSMSASAGTSASPSMSASAGTSAPPSVSASAGTSASSSSTAPTSAKVTEDWLTAAQIPFAATMHWSAAAPEHCTGQLEFNSTYAGGCVEHGTYQDPNPAVAMDTVVYTATNAPAEAGAWATPLASQAFYTYPSAADAQKAFQTLTEDILSSNGTSGGLSVNNIPVTIKAITTAQATDAVAIDNTLRDSNGNPAEVDGNASSASDRHFYFAVKGDTLEVLTIWGGPTISNSTNDATILASVAAALG